MGKVPSTFSVDQATHRLPRIGHNRWSSCARVPDAFRPPSAPTQRSSSVPKQTTESLIQTFSGNWIDPFNFKAEEVLIEDVAAHLSKLDRKSTRLNSSH